MGLKVGIDNLTLLAVSLSTHSMLGRVEGPTNSGGKRKGLGEVHEAVVEQQWLGCPQVGPCCRAEEVLCLQDAGTGLRLGPYRAALLDACAHQGPGVGRVDLGVQTITPGAAVH